MPARKASTGHLVRDDHTVAGMILAGTLVSEVVSEVVSATFVADVERRRADGRASASPVCGTEL